MHSAGILNVLLSFKYLPLQSAVPNSTAAAGSLLMTTLSHPGELRAMGEQSEAGMRPHSSPSEGFSQQQEEDQPPTGRAQTRSGLKAAAAARYAHRVQAC